MSAVFPIRDYREMPCLCLVVIDGGCERCVRCGFTPEQRESGRATWGVDALAVEW